MNFGGGVSITEGSSKELLGTAAATDPRKGSGGKGSHKGKNP